MTHSVFNWNDTKHCEMLHIQTRVLHTHTHIRRCFSYVSHLCWAPEHRCLFCVYIIDVYTHIHLVHTFHIDEDCQSWKSWSENWYNVTMFYIEMILPVSRCACVCVCVYLLYWECFWKRKKNITENCVGISSNNLSIANE